MKKHQNQVEAGGIEAAICSYYGLRLVFLLPEFSNIVMYRLSSLIISWRDEKPIRMQDDVEFLLVFILVLKDLHQLASDMKEMV